MTSADQDGTSSLEDEFRKVGIDDAVAKKLAEIAARTDSTAPRPTSEMTDEMVDKIVSRIVYILGQNANPEKCNRLRDLLIDFAVSFSASAAFGVLQYALTTSGMFFNAEEDDRMKQAMRDASDVAAASFDRFAEDELSFLDHSHASILKLREAFGSELEALLRESGIVQPGEEKLMLVMVRRNMERLVVQPVEAIVRARGMSASIS